MTFRKNAIFFYESEIVLVVVAVFCLSFIPIMGLCLSLICAIPCIVFALLNPKMFNELITINEKGISCQKSGTVNWEYDWDSIAELRKSCQCRKPVIYVIIYNKYGEAEQFPNPNDCFELGKSAREAIKQYYRPRNERKNGNN